jgi:signal transduction histidine kinase
MIGPKETYSRKTLLLVGLLLAAAVEIGDLLTGPEIAFSIFYLFVAGYFGWFFGLWPGIAAAVIFGIMSVWTDALLGVRYSHIALPFWAATMRMAMFSAVIVILLKLQAREKRLEEVVQELKQKNAELDHFSSMASHDLQAPLRTISLFSELLDRKLSEEGDAKEFLRHIRSASDRMHELIVGLLTYARITRKTETHEDVDLNSVVDDLKQDLLAAIQGKGGRVDRGNLPTVHANRLQMRQLLQNLMANALNYAKPHEPPIIRIEWTREKHRVELTIKDNGIGFDETDVDVIFAPFKRLSTNVPGTGMGLSICRKIAENHGGEITARSSPGQGSTFIVRLPLSLLCSPRTE